MPVATAVDIASFQRHAFCQIEFSWYRGARIVLALECCLATQRGQSPFQRFALHPPHTAAKRWLRHERVTLIPNAFPISVSR
jgi:hypothetical protein